MADERINRPGELFNQDGELFNSNTVPVRRRFLQQIPNPDAVRPAPPASAGSTGRNRTHMGSTRADLEQQKPIQVMAPVRRQRILTGAFSLVRAAQVAHQHRIGLWAADALPSYLGYTRAPETTPEQLDNQYNDLLLFSYLPAEMQISQDEFRQAASPPLRAKYLSAAQYRTGVSTPGNDAQVSAPVTPEAETPDKMPQPPPFAEATQSQCDDAQSYFQRKESALGYSSEQYRSENPPGRPVTVMGATV